ncbi:hypothetical protein [Azospirillum canadense]|uniref:hypothetical protein n=1 Tax=Azospirillum canadense TaxID=403962 RepID=UPI002227C1AD|nr:hypothetical protein [Azospirillum canadense]MCW2240372.1 intracellular multiplication protein IcmB [Azospirillum canadense]
MILGLLRSLAGQGADALERPLEHYVELETADEPYDGPSFVGRNRALMTVLRVRGTRDLKSAADRRRDVAALVKDLRSTMADVGYGVEVHYCRDPDRGGDAVADQMRGARAAATSIGLDMRAIHDAQEAFLAERSCSETCHVALWTMPWVMAPAEQKEALAAAAGPLKAWPFRRARDAQNPLRALTTLRNRHDGFVSAWRAALSGVGVEVDVLAVHDAGRDIFESLWPGEKADGFRLVLPGDPAPVMVPDDAEADPSAIIWPKVGRQLTAGAWSVDRVDWEVARFGSRLVASVDVVVGPHAPQDFAQLRDRLARAGGGGVPFRMSMKMRSGGTKQSGIGQALLHLASTFAALLGGLNRKIMKALDRVRERASEDGCVTWQLSFATWVSVDHPEHRKVLRMRMAELKRCVEQWGSMQARTMCGDPVQGALSSALGLSLESTAVQGYAPLAEALTMMPRRAASPWRHGAVPCLTPDGAIYPIEEGSAEVAYCFEIVIAVMRSGKSAWLARKVFGNILASGTDRLPFVFFPDVGFGSLGIIETLKEALPPKRRHLVAHAKMRNDAEHAINILDTPPGCRRPPADHLAMIQEAFIALVMPAEARHAPEGLSDLILRLIEDAYRLRDDANHNGDSYPYQAGRDPAVDGAIARAGIATRLPNGAAMPWWWIVDRLFEAGCVEESKRAQRYAVPVAEDLERLLSDDSIGKDFAKHADGRLIDLVSIGLKTALGQFVFCKGPTRFEPSARVIALDLQDVVGKGDSDAARKQTAVVYTWTIVAFTRTWWTEPRDVAANRTIPPLYREHHLRVAEDVAATPKVLVADEFHETGGAPATRDAIKKMARKGPKYRIRIHLASHVLRDFDDDMRELASSVTVISATTDKFKNDLCALFGLDEAHRDALGTLGKRDPKLGVPVFSITNTKRGRYAQLIYNAMSPVELWAVATNPQEVQLRRKLTDRVRSFSRAVMLLAAYEPFRQHGAEKEIELRITRAVERGDMDGAEEAKVIDGLVAELVAMDRERMLASGPAVFGPASPGRAA